MSVVGGIGNVAGATDVLVSRPLVQSLLHAVAPGPVAEAMHTGLFGPGGVATARAGRLTAAAGVRELQAAIGASALLDATSRARVDAVLELAAAGDALTIPQAATRLGLEPRVDTVRAALRDRGLDIVMHRPQGGSAVARVPEAFVGAASLDELLELAQPTAARAARAAEVEAESGAGAGHALLGRRGLRIAGAGGAIAALIIGGRALGGGDGSASATRAGAVGPEPANDDERRRADIANLALGREGISDLAPDGSLSPEVREWKAAAAEGRPDDPRAEWQVAFVADTLREAGAPVGVDGAGAPNIPMLRTWADQAGRLRGADDAGARAAGNAVFVDRVLDGGVVVPDLGVVVGPSKDGGSLIVAFGSQYDGTTATVDGEQVYVGSVALEQVPIAAPADGAVGTRITGYLDPVSPATPKPVEAPADPNAKENEARAAIVDRAAKHLHVREQPAKSNRGPEVDVFWASAGGGAGVANADRPWCAAFTSWLYNEQGLPFVGSRGTTGTETLYDWAHEVGAWRDARTDYAPKPGDLIEFKLSDKANRRVTHVGIVESYDPASRTITTIEGNTSGTEATDNGGGVHRKTWPMDDQRVIGFVNVMEWYRSKGAL